MFPFHVPNFNVAKKTALDEHWSECSFENDSDRSGEKQFSKANLITSERIHMAKIELQHTLLLYFCIQVSSEYANTGEEHLERWESWEDFRHSHFVEAHEFLNEKWAWFCLWCKQTTSNNYFSFLEFLLSRKRNEIIFVITSLSLVALRLYSKSHDI